MGEHGCILGALGWYGCMDAWESMGRMCVGDSGYAVVSIRMRIWLCMGVSVSMYVRLY